MLEYIFSFLIGGGITVTIVYFEANGLPLVSRLAALFPIFTWLSYVFIGQISGPEAVSKHSMFVLLGTLVAWVPYMFVIYLLAPKVGSTKAIIAGIVTFLVLATAFSLLYKK